MAASLAAAAFAACGGEVEFKALEYKPGKTLEAKEYKPGKTLGVKTYKEKVFTPKDAPAAPAPKVHGEKPYAQQPDQHLDLPVYAKEGKAAEDKAYKPGTPQKVLTIPPDPRLVPEKKPFDDKGKKVEAKEYKPEEKPAAENPLLKPRQGIKELPHDNE
jgi:hypothetical protein